MNRDEADEVRRRRGYELEMHRILAAADPEWVEKYAAFIEATYTGPRLLDRKTKELLQIAVEAPCARTSIRSAPTSGWRSGRGRRRARSSRPSRR